MCSVWDASEQWATLWSASISLTVFALYALRHLCVLSNLLHLLSVSEYRVAARAQPYELPAASFDPTSLPWPNRITRIS